MKYFSVVLFLACAALACKFAVQSHPFQLEYFAVVSQPDIRAALSGMGLIFPPVASKGAAQDLVKQPTPRPVRLLDPHEMQKIISAASTKHRVPAAFVKSIVRAESNFNCDAVSPKGAMGLMQLMPATAIEYGASDPSVPAQNIDAGTRYLRFLMDRYGTKRNSLKRVIAAYNAGPGNVDRYRGIPPFRETRTYVTRVMGFMREFEGPRKRLVASARPARRARGSSPGAETLE
jgi:soluble lytic murein transglycosylase-like protein